MFPVNLELSTPPKKRMNFPSSPTMHQYLPHVSSPFSSDSLVAGSNEMPIELEGIVPAEKRLSVTVGMLELELGSRVPTVRSTGPILIGKTSVQ